MYISKHNIIYKMNYYLKQDKKIFFYPKEFQKVLELAKEKQKYYILFLLNTGARINEIRHVREEDINKERKAIKLWVTKVRARLKEKRPDPREIAISTKFYKYLKRNISIYKIPTTSAVDQALKSLADKAKIKNCKDFSAHNLRKTFGTWMLALGVDGFKLAQHLGHDSETLRRSYASPDIFNDNDKDRMREILDDLPSRLRAI